MIYDKRIDEISGFMTAKAVLCRTGIQEYYGMELQDLPELEPEKIYKVYRPAQEVFKKESLDSFINCIVTRDHPSEAVNNENYRLLAIGSISEPFVDGDTVVANLTVYDKQAQDDIQNGIVELSVGYKSPLIKKGGEYAEIDCDFVQTEIRANHIALVARGRCGEKCKIVADKDVIITSENIKRTDMKVNGKEYKVDTDLEEDFKAEIKKLQDEISELKKVNKDTEKEKDELEATKDSLSAKIETLKNKQLKDSDIQELVKKRAELFTVAKEIAKDITVDMCPCDIKKAVIAKVLPSVSLDKKSDAYLEASYDIALDMHKQSSVKKVAKELAQDEKPDSHIAYVNKLENDWRQK